LHFVGASVELGLVEGFVTESWIMWHVVASTELACYSPSRWAALSFHTPPSST
jgi:hypothetical protein